MQRTKWLRYGIAVTALAVLVSCGTGGSSGNGMGMQSYKDTKSMVIDILKSEDAQKVLQESMDKQKTKGKDMKMQMLLDSPQGHNVQMAVKDILTDPHYAQMLHEMMTDPRFAGEFAKAIKKDNKQLLKELMKDPEYQTLMVDTMKGPQFQKMIVDVMKGPAYRKQTMAVIKDALENPLYRVELMSLMKKVMEEESKPKETKKSEKKGSETGGESSSGKSA